MSQKSSLLQSRPHCLIGANAEQRTQIADELVSIGGTADSLACKRGNVSQ